jgi:nicotinamidase/pyrazinamidase
MKIKLLVIDPQNDFCDVEGAALPVPGASADLTRLAQFLRQADGAVAEVIVTLDSHPSVAIERTSFWQGRDGGPVAPFTQITEGQVREGSYRPRNPALTDEVLHYLHELEAAGHYRLMVWPVHCVVGTWGHNIQPALGAEIARWEERVQRGALKVLKGANPLTEQYSAVRAEVPRSDDPATQTNRLLIERTLPQEGERLIVAGEAGSHCVAATLADLFAAMSREERARVILLRDCMSPVAGFEQAHEDFLAKAAAQGAQVLDRPAALAAAGVNPQQA